MINFAWNLNQERRIGDAQRTADVAKDKSEFTRDKAHELECRINRLTLLSQAMWELLSAQSDFNDDTLLAKAKEIDVRDGQADGKVSASVRDCPNCETGKISSKRSFCMVCGYVCTVGEMFNS